LRFILGKILIACQGVKILVTSIYPMHTLAVDSITIQESVHKVQQLSAPESAKLFLQYANLSLESPEDAKQVQLFMNREDLGAAQTFDCFKDHDMFRKMKGHPTVIILHASKTLQKYSLEQIYAMLSSSTFQVYQPLTASFETSFGQLMGQNQVSSLRRPHQIFDSKLQVQLLCLVGLMPQGLQLSEIDLIMPGPDNFAMLNNLIDFSFLELANQSTVVYRVLMKYMNHYLEIKSRELFPERELHLATCRYFLKLAQKAYDQLDVEKHRGVQEQLKSDLAYHQSNIWACLQRIHLFYRVEQES
jgi:hypothetical protein